MRYLEEHKVGLPVRRRLRADRSGRGAVRSAGRRQAADPSRRVVRLRGGEGRDRLDRSPKAASAPAPARRSASSAAAATPMKGGIGTASITLPSGLTVAALVAVNAGGDIVDPRPAASSPGARGADGKTFLDARHAAAIGRDGQAAARREHHARRRRDQREAHQGAGARRWPRWRTMASRAPSCPSHTMNDGDTIFALGHRRVHAATPTCTIIGGARRRT